MEKKIMEEKINVFVSYAHGDERLLKELDKHLMQMKRQNIIDVWHDRNISAGKEWEYEIHSRLNAASIILLLISPNFMNSEYCYSIELKRAMERHERGEARVIPIILRPVHWESASFSKLQALPTGAKPLTEWNNQDKAFVNVIQGIQRAIDEIVPKFHTVVGTQGVTLSPRILAPNPLWSICEDTFDSRVKWLRSQETVYTIGNGYFCTRGTFEESFSYATPATLLFGVFDSIPIAKEELANVPDWLPIRLSVNGERFHLEKGSILEYRRILDIRNGILNRIVRWRSPSGIQLRIQSERFASLADEHLGVIRYSVTVEKHQSRTHEFDLELLATFNMAVGNYDVMHWETVDQGSLGDIVWLESKTKRSSVKLAQTMSFVTRTLGFRKELFDVGPMPSIRLAGKLRVGETVVVEKNVFLYTSRDVSSPVTAAIQAHRTIIEEINKATQLQRSNEAIQGFEVLRSRHIEAWQNYWNISDILIEGDMKAQLAIRYSLYQLRINASPHDSHYSIASKGLTGFGYRGHIFFDTEILMLPFYIYVMPDIARNLLLYRYFLLPTARRNAASNGYEGAQYPWESTLSGQETTPLSIIHPETGEAISVLNGLIEVHITASIAHAIWLYWQVTGDDYFMLNYGTETMLSTALFWVSRAQKNHESNEYEITDVIGPDEWHEHVNNNAYTNYMAQHNIQTALEILQWLRRSEPDKAAEMEQELGLNQQRLEHWRNVRDHLRVPQDPQTGLFEQFDGFFKLASLSQSTFKGRQDSYQGILGLNAVQQYQIIKQADVLLLLSILNQQFDLETKRVNWDYYYPITDHDYGSSLTPALHAILACELGLVDVAYKQFLQGGFVDLENLRGNTSEGIHLSCSGAVWQAIIFGFAGLHVTEEGYTTSPTWPDGWTRLAFTFKYKGKSTFIDLRRSELDQLIES